MVRDLGSRAAGLDRDDSTTSHVHEIEAGLENLCTVLCCSRDAQDRPFLKRTCLLIVEEARVSRPLGHSRWMLTIRYVITSDYGRASSTRLTESELQAADRRRQTVISDLLKADHRRQRQLVEALKIVKSLKTQMIELQRQQGPAKDPAEPELPEEASSSS
ncbi:hypothetical protein Tco_0506360 [Tanacetum coccineum]